jgi:hypothetical protein
MKSYLLPFVVFTLAQLTCLAQSVQRQTTSSAGSSSVDQKIIGQPYGTNTYDSDKLSYRPGFQQPVFKVEPISVGLNLSVFPNPATDMVTITSKVIITKAEVRVTDANGKLLFKQDFEELKECKINCQNWMDAAYFITVTNDKSKTYTAKLIINR